MGPAPCQLVPFLLPLIGTGGDVSALHRKSATSCRYVVTQAQILLNIVWSLCIARVPWASQHRSRCLPRVQLHIVLFYILLITHVCTDTPIRHRLKTYVHVHVYTGQTI